MHGPHDVERDGLAWREAGAGEAIVLLHGLGGSRISWEPQLVALSVHHRVVAWDLPGYGAADALDGPVTFEALAAAVGRLLDAIGVESAHLTGISFGGMIAQYAAAAMPSRICTLTLLATSPKFGLDGTDPAAWRATRLAPLDAGQSPADFARRVLSSLAGPGITDDALVGQIAAMSRIGADALRRSIDCLVTHDSRGVLPKVTASTLCLVGELDDETPPAYLAAIAELIPNAHLVVVPGAGHLLNVEAPHVVDRLMLDHVEQWREGGA